MLIFTSFSSIQKTLGICPPVLGSYPKLFFFFITLSQHISLEIKSCCQLTLILCLQKYLSTNFLHNAESCWIIFHPKTTNKIPSLIPLCSSSGLFYYIFLYLWFFESPFAFCPMFSFILPSDRSTLFHIKYGLTVATTLITNHSGHLSLLILAKLSSYVSSYDYINSLLTISSTLVPMVALILRLFSISFIPWLFFLILLLKYLCFWDLHIVLFSILSHSQSPSP